MSSVKAIIALSITLVVIGGISLFHENQRFGAPSTNFQRTILPESDSAFDIGTSTNAWREGWFDSLAVTGLPSEDCIGTDANGVMQSGTCGGSSSLEFDYGTNTFGQISAATSSALEITSTGTSTFAGGLEAWRQIAAPYFHATSTATSTFAGPITMVHPNHLTVHAIRGDASDGLTLKASNYSTVATFGAGGGQNITFPGYTSALLQTSAAGAVQEYSGTSCTNQFVRALSALGIATCASVNLSSDVTGTLDISNSTNLAATWPVILSGDTITWGGLATTSQPTAGQILYSNGTNGLVPVATSSITYNSPITTSGTAGYIIGGSGFTLDVDDIQPADLAAADFGDFTCNATNCSIDSGVVGTTELTNDSILEIDLDVTNTPTDNYVLTYDSGTGGFTWEADQTGSGFGQAWNVVSQNPSFIAPTTTTSILVGTTTIPTNPTTAAFFATTTNATSILDLYTDNNALAYSFSGSGGLITLYGLGSDNRVLFDSTNDWNFGTDDADNFFIYNVTNDVTALRAAADGSRLNLHSSANQVEFGLSTGNSAIFDYSALSVDRIITLRDAAGTVILSGDTFTGDVTGTLDTDGSTALAIGSGVIIEPDLNADNSPTDGDYLQYDSTGTNFVWRTAANLVSDIASALDSAITTLSNLTTVGALNAGSITSGFGNIDNGSSNLTSGGTITFGGLSDGLIRVTTGVLAGGASVNAGEYSAGSIDGDDVNSNIAGRSLTLTAGSPDTLDADAELYTHSASANIIATSTADGIATSTEVLLSRRFPVAATITRIDCLAYDAGTSTIRAKINNTTDILYGSGINCGADLDTASTTLQNTSLSAGDRITVWVEDAEPTGSRPRLIDFSVTWTNND